MENSSDTPPPRWYRYNRCCQTSINRWENVLTVTTLDQRLDKTSWQTSESVRESVWMIHSVPCRTRWVVWSGSHSVTESLRTSRALSVAARDLFQEECLCLDTINIDIHTCRNIGYICTFRRTDGRRSVNVRLFHYVQMPCQTSEVYIHSYRYNT